MKSTPFPYCCHMTSSNRILHLLIAKINFNQLNKHDLQLNKDQCHKTRCHFNLEGSQIYLLIFIPLWSLLDNKSGRLTFCCVQRVNWCCAVEFSVLIRVFSKMFCNLLSAAKITEVDCDGCKTLQFQTPVESRNSLKNLRCNSMLITFYFFVFLSLTAKVKEACYKIVNKLRK